MFFLSKKKICLEQNFDKYFNLTSIKKLNLSSEEKNI